MLYNKKYGFNLFSVEDGGKNSIIAMTMKKYKRLPDNQHMPCLRSEREKNVKWRNYKNEKTKDFKRKEILTICNVE